VLALDEAGGHLVSYDYELAVLIPVLNRPHRIPIVAANLFDVSPSAHTVFIVDLRAKDDLAMWRALNEVNEEYDNIDFVVVHDPCPAVGNYAKKINKAYKYVSAEWIFTGADDLHWHPGWWEATAEYRSDPNVGVIGTNDLGHPRVRDLHETATHSLVSSAYIRILGATLDEPGKIIHEGYVHEFIDDELVGVAKMRKVWAFAARSYVEHMHPIWGKGNWDDSYNDQGRRMNESRAYYAERCKLWGGVPL
jgi:glycosyltransferase involved in cell wall biosynthesis